jgi:hypothetical protein
MFATRPPAGRSAAGRSVDSGRPGRAAQASDGRTGAQAALGPPAQNEPGRGRAIEPAGRRAGGGGRGGRAKTKGEVRPCLNNRLTTARHAGHAASTGSAVPTMSASTGPRRNGSGGSACRSYPTEGMSTSVHGLMTAKAGRAFALRSPAPLATAVNAPSTRIARSCGDSLRSAASNAGWHDRRPGCPRSDLRRRASSRLAGRQVSRRCGLFLVTLRRRTDS